MAERDGDKDLMREIAGKASRKLRSRASGRNPLWLGLGAFGIVGWSVALPTLIGVAAGIWLDGVLDDRISWTVTGLFAGAAIGCVIAWLWVSRTSRGDRP
jgi:ATP synthase protein I